MDLFPNLRVVSNAGAGVDHIDVKAATERGIKVGSTKNEVVDSTADMAFALLLAAARKVVLEDSKCRVIKKVKCLWGDFGWKMQNDFNAIFFRVRPFNF